MTTHTEHRTITNPSEVRCRECHEPVKGATFVWEEPDEIPIPGGGTYKDADRITDYILEPCGHHARYYSKPDGSRMTPEEEGINP